MAGQRQARARRLRAAWATAALTCLALAGCGGDGGGGEDPVQREVSAALREIQEAFVAGDAGTVCARLTPRARFEIGAAGHGSTLPCERNIGRFMSSIQRSGDRRGAPPPEVTAIDVTAVTATLSVGRRSTTRVPLVREGGEWKLGDFLGFSPRSRFSR